MEKKPEAPSFPPRLAQTLTGQPSIAALYLYEVSTSGPDTAGVNGIRCGILFAEDFALSARQEVCRAVASWPSARVDNCSIDVQDIEDLPLDVRWQILTEGRLVFSNDEGRLSQFKSRQAVERDLAEAEDAERNFRGTSEKIEWPEQLSTVLHAIMHSEVKLSNWLGPNVDAISVSKYDEIKSGISEIVEFRQSDQQASYLGLSLDSTFGVEEDKVEFMVPWRPSRAITLSLIRSEIDRGSLSLVKYFRSDYTGYGGPLYSVPRVVVGTDPQTAMELAQLWMRVEEDRAGASQSMDLNAWCASAVQS